MSERFPSDELQDLTKFYCDFTQPPCAKKRDCSIFSIDNKQSIYVSPCFGGKQIGINTEYASAEINKNRSSDGQCNFIYRNPIIENRFYGSNDLRSSNKEKIAYFLCNSCLKSLESSINTKDRLVFFLLYKDYICRLSLCFILGKIKLLEERKNNTLNDLEVEILYQDYKIFIELYQLIEDKWLDIEIKFQKNKRFVFSSGLELFLNIINTHLENDYKLFFENRKENNIKKKKKENDFLKNRLSKANEKLVDKNIIGGKTKEKSAKNADRKENQNKEKFQKIIWSDGQNYWLYQVKSFCKCNASKDQRIQKHMTKINKLVLDKQKYIEDKQYKKYPNYTMLDGIFYFGILQKDVQGNIRGSRKSNKT